MNQHSAAAIAGIVCLLLSFGCAQSSPAEIDQAVTGSSLATSEALRQRLPGLIELARIPGISACVIRGGEVKWCDAFGERISGGGSPVETTTVFQAASLSKPVFAYTVLQLVDSGEIELDQSLIELVGESVARAEHLGESFDDPRIAQITARMALSHTSGLPNWRRSSELALLFEPGAQFNYSGEAFGLLQMVVEELTGSSIEELVTRYTFEPLGMESSTFEPDQVDLENYAWGHDGAGSLDPGTDEIEEWRAELRAHSASTLFTTAPDYARFIVALMQGRNLDRETHQDMVRGQIEVDDVVDWGLGVAIEANQEGAIIWHWGDNGASKAIFAADLATGAGVVYFANSVHGLSIVKEALELGLGSSPKLISCTLIDDYQRYDSPGFRFETAVYEQDVDAAVALVRDTWAEGSTEAVSEAGINNMSYRLLQAGRVEDAITLFELNVELFPGSSNPHDSLGEALEAAGRFEEAAASFSKAFELGKTHDDPNTEIYGQNLDRVSAALG